jgi:hypothetical protein
MTANEIGRCLLSLPSWQNLGRLVLALSLDVAWLLATVADALLGLCRWALSGDVTCLATVVALLTTALGAVLAVVTIATARLEAVSYVSWRVRINLRSRSGHHLVLLQHHTLRRVHHHSLHHVRRRRSYRHQPGGTNERYDRPGHLCIVSNNPSQQQRNTDICSTLVRHRLLLRRSLRRCCRPSFHRHRRRSVGCRAGRSHGLDGLHHHICSRSLAWEHLGIRG